jgi:putative SOS response-associated peptidase YedK
MPTARHREAICGGCFRRERGLSAIQNEPWSTKQDIWFAFGEEPPTAFFAGIWAPQWTSVRKIKTGEETIDLYAFLTTDPNAEVGAAHPKAMPVILTTPEECETWMTAPWEARALQRPLPDGSLDIFARGVKKDGDSSEEDRPAQASLLQINPRTDQRRTSDRWLGQDSRS